ncbi:hypothetical protein Glove_253g71 [Diversispora epigaea]|uniref:Uncharacterized protein n=1 Tax=Diversispora epigaea TaxID=1348612 RepID=A0A397I7P3_9GLOM|nr:hypothetical protein Glove_253g71 [Diversispora epigaea]
MQTKLEKGITWQFLLVQLTGYRALKSPQSPGINRVFAKKEFEIFWQEEITGLSFLELTEKKIHIKQLESSFHTNKKRTTDQAFNDDGIGVYNTHENRLRLEERPCVCNPSLGEAVWNWLFTTPTHENRLHLEKRPCVRNPFPFGEADNKSRNENKENKEGGIKYFLSGFWALLYDKLFSLPESMT